jgi:hypothetical protein
MQLFVKGSYVVGIILSNGCVLILGFRFQVSGFRFHNSHLSLETSETTMDLFQYDDHDDAHEAASARSSDQQKSFDAQPTPERKRARMRRRQKRQPGRVPIPQPGPAAAAAELPLPPFAVTPTALTRKRTAQEAFHAHRHAYSAPVKSRAESKLTRNSETTHPTIQYMSADRAKLINSVYLWRGKYMDEVRRRQRQSKQVVQVEKIVYIEKIVHVDKQAVLEKEEEEEEEVEHHGTVLNQNEVQRAAAAVAVSTSSDSEHSERASLDKETFISETVRREQLKRMELVRLLLESKHACTDKENTIQVLGNHLERAVSTLNDQDTQLRVMSEKIGQLQEKENTLCQVELMNSILELETGRRKM